MITWGTWRINRATAARAPTLVAPAIVAASTPDSAATALKLLSIHPSAALDAASLSPLLSDGAAHLQELVLRASKESSQLVDALCTRSEAVQAALSALEMLRAAMVPTVAQLIKKLFDTDQGFTATLRAIAEGEERGKAGRKASRPHV